MSDPLTVEQRLSAVESELQFLKNLWMLRAFAVALPRNAPRDPRVLPRPRPRQQGHL